jgi:hypothetical protein
VAAVGQELHSAVREEDHRALLGLLRWQTLRVAYRLRELAGRDQSGPIVLAAAHTAGALQGLLGLLEQGPLLRDALAGEAELDDEQVLALPAELGTAREALASADANLAILAGMLAGAQDVRAFGAEELDGVERELLQAAVQLAPDGGMPDRGEATLALCGALAPVAKHVREQASAVTLRPHVAKLGGAAATFLISLSSPGPSRATLDSARRHVIVAVLHGATGISRFTPDQLVGERWFLHVVEEIGELMAYAASGQATSDPAYTKRVTKHAIATLATCGAWLAQHRPDP